MHSLSRLLAWGGLLLLLMANAVAQETTDTLAQRLINLRGQVDDLQNELDTRREEHKNKMVYLSAQLVDLDASREREALRVRQLRQELDEMRQEISEGGVNAEKLLPFTLNQIAVLREQIAQGFPFKTRERLLEIDKLTSELHSGAITAQRGINRLWAFIEDELRISHENAIYSQPVMLNGNNVLVDIAKLGSVMMFFRTRGFQYGRAVYTPHGWRFELLDSEEDQEQVAHLFGSLQKQIRQGYFELPAVLPPRLEAPS